MVRRLFLKEKIYNASITSFLDLVVRLWKKKTHSIKGYDQGNLLAKLSSWVALGVPSNRGGRLLNCVSKT